MVQLKIIGKVTEKERDEIKTLFERKNGLIELFKVINPEDNLLYEKMVKDMGETSTKFQKWWDEISKKNKWEGSNDSHWEINFDTCEIFLSKNK